MRAVWLGRRPYRPVLALQERLRERVLDGGAEHLLLLEHEPVITLGRSADATHVLLPSAELAARGVEVVQTGRGGDVTWHGPGQLVAYPIVRVAHGVARHVEQLAQAVIALCAARGIVATWDPARPGVWVGDAKLCAFGLHLHRGVAIHGLALNALDVASAFRAIVPCGLSGAAVTSLAALGHPITPEALAPELAAHLEAALGCDHGLVPVGEVALPRVSPEELLADARAAAGPAWPAASPAPPNGGRA